MYELGNTSPSLNPAADYVPITVQSVIVYSLHNKPTGVSLLLAFREALRTAFPLKGDQDIEELVLAAQSELQTSGGSFAYQRLYTEVSSKTFNSKTKHICTKKAFVWSLCLLT